MDIQCIHLDLPIAFTCYSSSTSSSCSVCCPTDRPTVRPLYINIYVHTYLCIKLFLQTFFYHISVVHWYINLKISNFKIANTQEPTPTNVTLFLLKSTCTNARPNHHHHHLTYSYIVCWTQHTRTVTHIQSHYVRKYAIETNSVAKHIVHPILATRCVICM